MKFSKLLTDRVLVRLEPVPEKTAGGIIRPDTAPALARVGRVLQVGPGRRRYHGRRNNSELRLVFHPTEVRPGERVAFLIGSVDTRGGKAVTHHLNEDERLIREDDILGVIADGVQVEV